MNQEQTMTVTVLENTEDYVRVIARFGTRLWSVYGASFPLFLAHTVLHFFNEQADRCRLK
jgi:hypothetical protein